MSLLSYASYAKDAAAVLGVGGVLYSVYTVSGLPIPATVYQLDQRVRPLEVGVNDTQRNVLAMRRSFLRNEKYTIQRSIEAGDPQTKIIGASRILEIDDEIAQIEKRDDALSKKSFELNK